MSFSRYFQHQFFNRLQFQAGRYKLPAKQQAVNVGGNIMTTQTKLKQIKFKNLIVALFICAIGTLLIFAANKSNTKDKLTLQDLSFYKGQLTNYYPAKLYHSSTANTSKFIALDITGLDQKIRVFKPGEDYSDFYKNIHIGDTISIYYRKHSPDYFNSDIYQLDVNNKNYLKIDEVKSNHKKGNIAIFIIGLFMYGLALYSLFRK